MKNFLLPLLIFAFFQSALLMGYDPNDTNTFSLTTNFCSVGSDTEGRSYAIACTPVTAQDYCDFLNGVALVPAAGSTNGIDPHKLYSQIMFNSSPYWKKIPFARICKQEGAYSVAELDNPTTPMTFMTLFRAARYINWWNNGRQQGGAGAASTESGTYLIYDHLINNASVYQYILPDASGISAAILKDYSDRQSNHDKPPLKMVFLAPEAVLVSFNNATDGKYDPIMVDTNGNSAPYFFEWSCTPFQWNANSPVHYGGYFQVQGGGYAEGQPSGPLLNSDNPFYKVGFRLMEVTFPTNFYSTNVPVGPTLPLVLPTLLP